MDRGPAGVAPWNALLPRAIPLFRFTDLISYADLSTQAASGGRQVITGRLPSNLQITPYIRVDAPAGAVIEMQTDHYLDGGEPNVRSTYTTRSGVQEFESLGWMSGTSVQYQVSSGVRVIAVGYRESGYATTFAGTFSSSDAVLDQLWQKAARTVYVNMRDSYMDCPTRERAQWWADAVNEIRSGAYAFDPQAHALGGKAIRDLVRWRRPNAELFSPVPSGFWTAELPQQMLASIWGTWQYYLLTGDGSWMTESYQALRNHLDQWPAAPGRPGLVDHRFGEWDWSDWGDNIDPQMMENAWYALAVQAVANMAHLVGRTEDEAMWRGRLAALASAVDQLWDPARGAYRWPTYGRATDERGSALLVVAGLVPASRYAALTRTLLNQRNASPYMEFYVLEALYLMDAPNEAITRMRARYLAEVTGPNAGPTLWEFWNTKDGSTNHGWSAGPLYVLSAYAAGVHPIDPGFARYELRPRLGPLTHVRAVVPTTHGPITTDVSTTDSRTQQILLQSPAGTVARVAVPWTSANGGYITVNGVEVYTAGRATGTISGATYVGSDERTVSFDLAPGAWTVVSTGAGAPGFSPPRSQIPADSSTFKRPVAPPLTPPARIPPALRH
jgi:hypothetical protein